MMGKFLQHSVAYVGMRATLGLVNFLAIPVYTRLLSPSEYGVYMLVVAVAGFGNVIFFDWIRQSLLRYLPAHLPDVRSFLGNVLTVFLCCAIFFGGLSALVVLPFSRDLSVATVLVGMLLMIAQAWYELNQELARSLLKPMRFGAMLAIRAFVSLVTGVLLIRLFDMAALAPLIGLTFGMLLATSLWGRAQWSGAPLRVDVEMLKEMLRYGLPLTLSLLSTVIIGLSDRFLVSYYLGVDEAGAYAASYDFVQQAVAFVMSSISMAVYPLVIRSVELDGQEAAIQQAQRAFSLLVATSLPIVTLLSLFSHEVASLFLGEDFQEVATMLIPWLAVSMFVSGVRAYYYDMAFQISRRTIWHAGVLGVSALVNLLLNIWWLPRFGVIAAAYATLVSLVVALLGSIILGRQFVTLKVCWRDVFKVTAALATVVGLYLLWMRSLLGSTGRLGIQAAVCLLVYGIILFIFNAGNARHLLRPLAWRRREM